MQIRQNPFAAHGRRRAVRVRRRRQDAALAEQAPPRLVGHRHAPEVAAVDVRNLVVLGQPLVDERVVGRQQIEHVVVLAHDAVEEQLGLALKRLPQVVVEVREQIVRSAPSCAGSAAAATARRSCSTSASDASDRRASGAPAARAPPAVCNLPCAGQRPAAHRPECCSRERTRAAMPARNR